MFTSPEKKKAHKYKLNIFIAEIRKIKIIEK